jgi:hypothetical protein
MAKTTKKISKKTLKAVQKQAAAQAELRSAWMAKVESAIGRNNYVVAERKGETAKDYFVVLSGEEQYDAILRMAYALPKLAQKFADGDNEVIAVSWLKTEDDFRTVAHEGYCDLVGIADKEPNLPLGRALFRATWNACRRQARQAIHSISALQKSVEVDGEEVYEVDLTSFAAPRDESPEYRVLLETTLEECCRDEIDRAIVSYRHDGYTDEEIGDFLDMSKQAVEKRRRRFWDRFNDDGHLADDREISQYYCENVLEEIRQAYKPVAEFAERWHQVTSALQG